MGCHLRCRRPRTPCHQYAKVDGPPSLRRRYRRRQARLAKKVGADFVVNAKHGDPDAAVKKATNGGAHGVLITAPSLSAFKQGVGMTRKRGTCVLVGLPPGDFPVPLFDVVANCITIRGSFVGTREDMAETLAFAAEGKVKADIELQPWSRSTASSIGSSMARLRAAWFSISSALRRSSINQMFCKKKAKRMDGSEIVG